MYFWSCQYVVFVLCVFVAGQKLLPIPPQQQLVGQSLKRARAIEQEQVVKLVVIKILLLLHVNIFVAVIAVRYFYPKRIWVLGSR